MLGLEARRHRLWLVVGTRGMHQTIFWTPNTERIPAFESFHPTERFNRLKGCKLDQVLIPQPDRVIRLTFVKPSRQGDQAEQLDLWITWIAAAGNLLLVQPTTANVLEAFWPTMPRIKDASFSPPAPPPLLDWRTIAFPDFERERSLCSDLSLSEFLRKKFWGIDLPLALMIEEDAAGFAGQSDQSWGEFSSALRVLRAAVDPRTPLLVLREATQAAAILPNLRALAGKGQEQFASLAMSLAALDAQSSLESDREVLIAKLRREVEDRAHRLGHRIRETNRAIADGPRAAQLRHHADLLGTQRERLRPGMTDISVEDWETDAEVVIALDPAIRPQENIDTLYRLASKVERAAENAQRVQPALNRDLETWQSRLHSLDDPSISNEELDAIRASCGLPESDNRSRKARPPKRLPYREFRVGESVILVGRSSRDNDHLTMKIARAHDLFLHASQSGGAHVILRRETKDRDFDYQAIVAAAQVAAFFSKAKHSHLVPVVYTEVRHVRKPRKAPPGLVQVSKGKSVMARPLAPPGYHDAGYNE
jgi:predicted ribosome quality control (RQC) complex YloA/Tae2 family protein